MAKVLNAHWHKVFEQKAPDLQVMGQWFRELENRRNVHPQEEVLDARGRSRHDSAPDARQIGFCKHDEPLLRKRRLSWKLPSDHDVWKVRPKDLKKALDTSNNSAPGPDGIPFGAWRAVRKAGLTILLDTIECMEQEQAEAVFVEAYRGEAEEHQHNFNLSTLVCLPKDHTGEDPTMGKYYVPKSTRPLSIVNADNRLIASAMRIRWELQLSLYVKDRQQGFVKGRSLIKNLVDFDFATFMTAMDTDEGDALSLDFEAGFHQ